MKNFEEYVMDWFHEYIEEHKDSVSEVCEAVLGDKLGKTSSLDEYTNILSGISANEIYSTFFGWDAKDVKLDDIPTTFNFWEDMLNEYLKENEEYCYHDFMQIIVEDIASFMENYTYPNEFFEDLAKGGCSSGMIPMFIYNSDCMNFYSKHANEMEEFREQLEEEMGCALSSKDGIRHYVFMCWMCYEEVAYRIYRTLFPDEF